MAWWHRLGFWRWIVTGLLLGAGFIVPLLWPLGLVGVVMFLQLTLREESTGWDYFGAWLAWSIKAGMAIWWFWKAYPIMWLPGELSNIQLVLIGMCWITSALSLGMGGVLVYAAIKYIQKYATTKLLITDVAIPFVWVLGELAGAFAFSVVQMGPGGTITPAFSFSYIGYLPAVMPSLLFLAKAAGVYGLSYCFVVIAVALLRIPQRTTYHFWIAPVVAMIVLGSAATVQKVTQPAVSTELLEQRVLVIDTNFSSNAQHDREGVERVTIKTTQAVMVALAAQPDYIILPEDARFFVRSKSATTVRDKFASQYSEPETIIVDTGRAQVQDKTLLQSFVYAGPAQAVGQVHKRYLVPQGEYISYWLSALLQLFGYKPLVEEVLGNMSYRVGDRVDQSVLLDQVPAILFCFESADPVGVRRVLAEHPQAPFVAHPISHAWFHESTQLWQQLDVMLQIQAVWNQRYIISAGNRAVGKVYTPQGNTLVPEPIAEDLYWRVKEVTFK